MRKAKCETCVFRANELAGHLCDYATITGHTRLAEPPERCSYYQDASGVKLRKGRYEWELAERLYRQGRTDREISEALGCKVETVRYWRRMHGYKGCGRNKREERETDEYLFDKRAKDERYVRNHKRR